MADPGAPAVIGGHLKTLSLATLTLQHAALNIVLHYSRQSLPGEKMYSAASAVLLNEAFKGIISLGMSIKNARQDQEPTLKQGQEKDEVYRLGEAVKSVAREMFSPDCWKLAVPATLYVFQSNLQFIAATYLDVATFQVSYSLKIVTTAIFSVLFLGRRLSPRKWLSLFVLTAGVAIVWLQSFEGTEEAMHSAGTPGRGLIAVAVACVTHGLAVVYFELFFKDCTVDLWVGNAQLAIMSLLPAFFAAIGPDIALLSSPAHVAPVPGHQHLFANFGPWAWAVVVTQTLGGLATALVITHSNSTTKGFAASLAILLSFGAGVQLFGGQLEPAGIIGALWVILATYLFNMRETRGRAGSLRPPAFPNAANSGDIASTRTFLPPFVPSNVGTAPPSPLREDARRRRSSVSRQSSRALSTDTLWFEPLEARAMASKGNLHSFIRSPMMPGTGVSSAVASPRFWVPMTVPSPGLHPDVRRME